MISLPLTQEVERMVEKLPENDKRTLSLIIRAFVLSPKRDINQVMDDMAKYAQSQGLRLTDLDELLRDEQ